MTARELLLKLSNRLGSQNQTIDFVSALNTTITALTTYLWSINSDWVRSDFLTAYTVGATSVPLPSDFMGFVEPPYLVVSGSTGKPRIDPLPAKTDNTLKDTGTPKYYEMRGSTLRLLPVPDVAGSLKGRYNAKPAALESLDDDLPFSGFFDPILQDAVIMMAQQGLFVAQTPGFNAMISQQVDKVMSKRTPKRVHFRGFK